MKAISYPDPLSDPPPAPVRSLPQPRRGGSGLAWAVSVLAALVVGLVTYLIWPEAVPVRAETLLAGTAEQIVVAHLHGDVDALSRTVAVELPSGVEPGLHYVRAAGAVSVTESEHHTVVVVAVDRLLAVPGGYGDPRVEHFAVTFLHRPTGPIVAGLPALVPAPDPPSVLAAALPSPVDDELSRLVVEYLDWLLAAGDGSFQGPPVDPAPFASVALTGLHRQPRGGGFDLTANVIGHRPDGASLPMTYLLEALEGESGWEISRRGS